MIYHKSRTISLSRNNLERSSIAICFVHKISNIGPEYVYKDDQYQCIPKSHFLFDFNFDLNLEYHTFPLSCNSIEFGQTPLSEHTTSDIENSFFSHQQDNLTINRSAFIYIAWVYVFKHQHFFHDNWYFLNKTQIGQMLHDNHAQTKWLLLL